MLYSVFKKGRWAYYESPLDTASRVDRVPVGVRFLGGVPNEGDYLGPPDFLGLTPHEAAYPLPAVALQVGEGLTPQGKVATGRDLLGMAHTLFNVLSSAWLIKKISEKKERDNTKKISE